MNPGRRVIVIGAGAAGTMAAIFAASEGAETLLLEKTKSGGKKILISGGGRCNILPARLDESRFVTDSSKNSLRKIIRAWPSAEQITFFEREVGIRLKEESESGKLFPVSDRAAKVRDGLLRLAADRGAKFVPNSDVIDLLPIASGWRVAIRNGEPLDADAVIMATGGLSVPQTGSDGFGLRIARRLGHTIHPTYPALTPLTMTPPAHADLSGISLCVRITARDEARAAEAEGGFLFTHRGYSGPAVLDVSHVAVRSRGGDGASARIEVAWTDLDDAAWTAAMISDNHGARSVAGLLRKKLSARLVTMLMSHARVDAERRLARLSREERTRLIAALTRFELPWNAQPTRRVKRRG